MPVRRLLYTMSGPLALSLLVQSLYNIVDSIFVARLSEEALTATSLAYAVQVLMIALSVGTAVGLNALLSRCIGAGQVEEACRAATTGLWLTLISALIFAVSGIFSSTIAGWMTDDAVLQTLCAEYLTIVMLGSWGLFLQTYAQRLLQAVGDTVLSMASLLIGAGVNIVLNPLLIFGWCGLPALGVPALRIIAVTFVLAAVTTLCGYFASGLGNGLVNMLGSALRQLIVLVPAMALLLRFTGLPAIWYAFWLAEGTAFAYSLLTLRQMLHRLAEPKA